jgi:hypothetical protein
MKSGIIYKGPSRIDGAPIVVLATYSNRNTKTGAVVQTYILREDINPLEASKTGADASICGTCPLRGTPTSDPARKQAVGRRCYVNLGQGVLIVWRAYVNGVYPDAQDTSSARIAWARSRRALWHLWRSRSRTRPRVDRPAIGSGHMDSLHASKAVAPRYRNAVRGQPRRGARIGQQGAARSA